MPTTQIMSPFIDSYICVSKCVFFFYNFDFLCFFPSFTSLQVNIILNKIFLLIEWILFRCSVIHSHSFYHHPFTKQINVTHPLFVSCDRLNNKNSNYNAFRICLHLCIESDKRKQKKKTKRTELK